MGRARPFARKAYLMQMERKVQSYELSEKYSSAAWGAKVYGLTSEMKAAAIELVKVHLSKGYQDIELIAQEYDLSEEEVKLAVKEVIDGYTHSSSPFPFLMIEALSAARLAKEYGLESEMKAAVRLSIDVAVENEDYSSAIKTAMDWGLSEEVEKLERMASITPQVREAIRSDMEKAENLERSGDPIGASKIFVHINRAAAIRCIEAIERRGEEMREIGNDGNADSNFVHAAGFWSELGRADKAALAYEKAFQYHFAASQWLKIGKIGEAARCAGKLGDMGYHDRAASLLLEVCAREFEKMGAQEAASKLKILKNVFLMRQY